MRPRPRLGLPALRAVELVDGLYVSLTGVTLRAVVRQARRVVRSATHVWPSKVHYPAGVVIYLSPAAPARVRTVLHDMGCEAVAEEIARRLRDHTGRAPRLTVWLEPDETMSRPFEVAVLERPEPAGPARSPEPAAEDAGGALGASVLREWEALHLRVPRETDRLEWLAQSTGMPFRQLDAARRARNDLAHGRPVHRDRLLAAQQTIRLAYHRLPPLQYDGAQSHLGGG